MQPRPSKFLLLAAPCLCIVIAASAESARAAGIEGTYTDWIFANMPAEGFFNIDGYITPKNDPTPDSGQVQPAYFYSMQFGIVTGDGGYIGIQKDADGKRAIFSIWGATAATCSTEPGALCRPFTGEGDGYQTIIPYQWVAGHTYRTRVWALSTDADGDWWIGEIMDQNTGVASVVGTIRVPLGYQWLSYYTINWVEWYAPRPPSCDSVPESVVFFGAPLANGGAQNAGPPSSHFGDPTDCPSTMQDMNGGVLHRNGRDRLFVDGFDPR